MYEKVKSCPCCGKLNSIGIQTKYINSNIMYRVVCNEGGDANGCGLRSAWFPQISLAIEAWNMRANQ